MIKPTTILLAASLLLATACGNDKTEDGEHDPAAEGCEHLGAAATPITATAAGTATPTASIAADHKRYDVTLPDAPGGGKLGQVKFASAAAGHLLVYLSADLPIRLTDANGAEVTPSESGKTGPCTQLAAWYEFHVAVGPYTLALGGPSTTTSVVGVVLETETDAH